MIYCETHEEQESCPKCETEGLVEKMEGVANFMRGMTLDPRLPRDMKSAFLREVVELDTLTESKS